MLQKLLVLFRNHFQDSDILREFAQSCERWKKPLIEALTLMNAKKIIRKLGFNYEALKTLFLPHIAGMTYDINIIVKTLYLMSERMTIAEGGKMILKIQDTDTFAFFDHSYLEVFLLHWITESKITVHPPNLDSLLYHFKEEENIDLRDLLLDAIHYSRFTETPHVVTRPTKQKPSVNKTALDDIQHKEKFTGEGDREPFSVINSINDRSGAYIVRKDSAGFLFIINQTKFYKEKNNKDLIENLPEEELKNRDGTEKDKERLTEVFEQFGYRAEERKDLKHDEILPAIKEAVERSIVYDSLIICILSHGFEGHVYGSNSIPFKIDRIKEAMLECPALVGKPKILLVQACQGTKRQKPVSLSFVSNSSRFHYSYKLHDIF